MNNEISKNLEKLGFWWINVQAGKTTESELVASIGNPTRKIAQADKTIYLYKGVNPLALDSAQMKDGIVISLDYSPTAAAKFEDIQALLGSDTKNVESGFVDGGTIFLYEKYGLGVTTDIQGNVVRVSQFIPNQQIQIKPVSKTVSLVQQNTVTKLYLQYQPWILIAGGVILAVLCALIIKIVLRRLKLRRGANPV